MESKGTKQKKRDKEKKERYKSWIQRLRQFLRNDEKSVGSNRE